MNEAQSDQVISFALIAAVPGKTQLLYLFSVGALYTRCIQKFPD
jgi:hypothetical protein